MLYKAVRSTVCMLLCTVMTVMLSGCAEAPAEVIEEMEQIEQAREAGKKLKQQITYVPVSKLKQDAATEFTMENGVFQFHGEVSIPKCEHVYLLEMKVNDEIYANLDNSIPTIMKYLGEDTTEWNKFITRETGACFLEPPGASVSIMQTGGLTINRDKTGEEHPYFFTVDGQITERYSFINNREEILNREIDFNGQNVSLLDFDRIFEESMQVVNACSSGLSLELHDARIIEKNETGKKMVVLRALSTYEGVCFDPNYIVPQDSRVTGGKSFVGFEFNQQFHDIEDNCSIGLRETSYLVEGVKKEYFKVIDFNSALLIMESTVPRDKITNIESAEFFYQIYYEGEEGQGWRYVYETPPAFYATPVWRFVEKDRMDETKATVYYVDAVTGNVYSFYGACTP